MCFTLQSPSGVEIEVCKSAWYVYSITENLGLIQSILRKSSGIAQFEAGTSPLSLNRAIVLNFCDTD